MSSSGTSDVLCRIMCRILARRSQRIRVTSCPLPVRRQRRGARDAGWSIDYAQPGWSDGVKRLTARRGADVGGSLFDQSLAALVPFGRLVVYGSASRERSTLVPQRLMPLNQAVTVTTLAIGSRPGPSRRKRSSTRSPTSSSANAFASPLPNGCL